MATLKLTVRDSKIVAVNGHASENISEDGKRYVSGNYWTVMIQDAEGGRPGKIFCKAEKLYSTGLATYVREFKLADGLLGLSGGNVHSRYAYFRNKRYQDFLDEFGITAVVHEDPNRVFRAKSECSGWGTAWQKVVSDGQVEFRYEDDEDLRASFGEGSSAYAGTDVNVVSGATWAIVITHENWKDNHNHSVVLYTTAKNVMALRQSLRQYATNIENESA